MLKMYYFLLKCQYLVVQKWRKNATFLISTFELFVDIGKQIKTCPGGQVLKLWLCSVCGSRTDYYMDLIAIGHEIKNLKDKLELPNLH